MYKHRIGWLESSRPVYREYAEKSKALTLSGYRLYDFFNELIFERLSHYTKLKGYYAIAIFNMLVLKNNETSRLVLANFGNDEILRAFVEFRSKGIWWALDPTDEHPMLHWRFTHDLLYRVKRRRVISYDDFWRRYPIRKFYSYMHKPEVFSHPDDMPFFYRVNDYGESEFGASSQALHPKYPVSQEILDDYFEKSSRLFPKRRTHLISVRKSKKGPKIS